MYSYFSLYYDDKYINTIALNIGAITIITAFLEASFLQVERQ